MQLPYLHFRPVVTPPDDLAPTSAVIGRTTLGPGAVLRAYATLRGDGEAVRVGRNAWFGERATVHIEDSALPAVIGDDVTVGRYALVHACTVCDRVVVADAATVMDGASVGAGSLVAPGALVPPRKKLDGGWVYEGNPAVPLRRIEAVELAAIAAAVRSGSPSVATGQDLPPGDMAAYRPAGAGERVLYPLPGGSPRVGAAYVALTALVAGAVEIADDAGVYFGCVLHAGDGRIVIGPRSNIQDNSFLLTDRARGELVLGTGVTVGHNVRLGSGRIGDDALVGMSAVVGDGVVVEDGGLIAAGAVVEPGTVVRAGWIWAGRPARAFRAVKDSERAGFARGAEVYVRYCRAYLAG